MTTTASETKTTTWTLDATHSSVELAVKHMMFTTVRGRFKDVKGTIVVDEANPANSTVNVEIAAATLDTGVGDRDAHLRSADFLDVATYPELTFRSKRIEKAGDRYRAVGDLALHGVTREVVLDAEFAGTGKDPWGNQRAGFSAKASLDRREFGLVWNAALETGGVLVGEKVEISIELEAVKRAAAAPVAA